MFHFRGCKYIVLGSLPHAPPDSPAYSGARLLLCILDSARQPTSPHLSASVSHVQPLVNDGDAAAGACQPKGLAKEADVPEIQEVVPVVPVVPVVSDINALAMAPVLPGGEARATTASEWKSRSMSFGFNMFYSLWVVDEAFVNHIHMHSWWSWVVILISGMSRLQLL